MHIRELGIQPYDAIWERMKTFTLNRQEQTEDEVWLLEHFAVYTQGQAGKPEHILNPDKIPVIQTDRGGQVTYHGPGQLVGYFLMDIQRKNIGVRTLVTRLEQTIIDCLHYYEIDSERRCSAPGVYVKDRKIASIGLRVKHGKTYHGIALNVDMDLSPFKGINPCGFKQMEMTQVKDFIPDITLEAVKNQLIAAIRSTFED